MTLKHNWIRYWLKIGLNKQTFFQLNAKVFSKFKVVSLKTANNRICIIPCWFIIPIKINYHILFFFVFKAIINKGQSYSPPPTPNQKHYNWIKYFVVYIFTTFIDVNFYWSKPPTPTPTYTLFYAVTISLLYLQNIFWSLFPLLHSSWNKCFAFVVKRIKIYI